MPKAICNHCEKRRKLKSVRWRELSQPDGNHSKADLCKECQKALEMRLRIEHRGKA